MNIYLHIVDLFGNINNSFFDSQILSIYSLYFSESFAYFILVIDSYIQCINNQLHKVAHVRNNHNTLHCIWIWNICTWISFLFWLNLSWLIKDWESFLPLNKNKNYLKWLSWDNQVCRCWSFKIGSIWFVRGLAF